MTRNMLINASKRPALLTGVSATALGLALGLVLFVMVYGIVELPEHSLLTVNDVSASLQVGQVSGPVPKTALAASPAHSIRAVASGERRGVTEAPRECAPDQGITEACIY